MNLIVHGDTAVEADAAGMSLSAIRERLRQALSIPETATPFVDGRQAGPDDRLPPDAELEFLVTSGRKGVGRVWNPAQFCEEFACTREDLYRWVRQGLGVLVLADGDFRVTETAVDEFVRVTGVTPGGDARGECRPSGGSPSEVAWPDGHCPPEPAAPRPRWSPEERTLYVGERVVKHFVQPADNQEAVLEMFERRGWPCRIDNPLPSDPQVDRKRQRRDTVESLNRNHADPGVLRFESDGTGGIRWRLVGPSVR